MFYKTGFEKYSEDILQTASTAQRMRDLTVPPPYLDARCNRERQFGSKKDSFYEQFLLAARGKKGRYQALRTWSQTVMALNEGAVGRPSMLQTITKGFSLEVAPSGQLKSNGFE